MFKIISLLAKKSRLSKIHPMEKILLCIFPIVILGFSKNYIPLLINIIIFILLHIKAQNDFNIILKFVIAATGFALFSCITFIFDYGIIFCIVVLLKTTSAAISVSYLVLTTPLDDLLYICSKNNSLRDICDIAKSMERFLILIEDEYKIMYKSMKCRGGFDTFFSKIKNMGKLAGLLFINTMHRWNDIKSAINSRGYSGFMPYIKRTFNFSKIRLSYILCYNVLLIVVIHYAY